jgi:glyoxylase-like metal-dependent hydrolase (beta-lactamase superfamily II)
MHSEVSLSDGPYEVYAIRYGHFDARSPMNYLGGDSHDVPDPLDYYVWAIIGNGRTYVVDSGFDEARSKARKRQLVKPVGEGLKAIGVDPESVSDVIVTHMHYDHVGNHTLFPHAKYHLQDDEMIYATGRCMCHAHMRLPFDADDVTAMVERVFSGRLEFHDGDDSIAPGITLHKIGGHSKGLQCVRVKTRRGDLILASDSMHLYRHLEQDRIYPVFHSIEGVLEGYKRVRRLALSPQHIIPGHDPLVLTRYEAPAEGLRGWVARVDLDPKQ